MKLQGRVALITGAGSGLGRAIALTFARQGARVAINDVSRAAAERVAAELAAAGVEALALVADVSDSVEVRGMFEEISERWDRLDILVNNAGIATLSEQVKTNMATRAMELASTGASNTAIAATRTMSDSQWRRMLSIHLDGTFYCTREALAIMEPRGAGAIINMASVAGTCGLAGSPDYSAAKAGIIGLTRSVAREVVSSGVRVNAIAPGFIDTPLLDMLDEPMKGVLALQIPIGRLGTPDEVAAVALFLASDDASYMVGQVISPNGGWDI